MHPLTIISAMAAISMLLSQLAAAFATIPALAHLHAHIGVLVQ